MKPSSADLSPWISILIPHKEAVVAACRTLESILDQAGNLPVEIHVQDAASPEADLAALRAFGPAVQVDSAPDGGIYDGIGRAIRATSGKYILVLGAGDQLRPGVLAQILPVLHASQPKALYGDVFMEDLGVRYRGEFQPHDFFRHNVCQQGLFYSREVIDELGEFRQEFPLLADYEFNVRMFSGHRDKITYWPGIVADYLGGGASADRWRDDPFIALRDACVSRAFGIERKSRHPRQVIR